MTTYYKAKDVDGRTHYRSSLHRTFTHAVAGGIGRPRWFPSLGEAEEWVKSHPGRPLEIIEAIPIDKKEYVALQKKGIWA